MLVSSETALRSSVGNCNWPATGEVYIISSEVIG